MKSTLLLIFALLVACSDTVSTNKGVADDTNPYSVITNEYELYKPDAQSKAVLVLFGGFPESIARVQSEFGIKDIALQNKVAVLYLNYNQKLWLEEEEKRTLADSLKSIFVQHKLPPSNVCFGGYSSGGNVSLLLANYLIQNEYTIAPKGVFVVDSPIDLAALYKSSEKNIQRNFSEVSVQESTFLVKLLSDSLGDPHADLSRYEDYAVFTSTTNNFENIKSLKGAKIRLYTEPDTTWWKENRMADHDQMNAFYLKELSEALKSSDFKHAEYITTENKGYRANGERHPHSWSIVDKDDLIKWMLE